MEKIQDIIAQLTIEEKVGLLSGKNGWETFNIERFHIPSIWLSDGPNGVRKLPDALSVADGEAIQAVCFPPESTIACSFNRDLVRQMGSAIGAEAIKENTHVILGPGLNIKRNPLGGRNFEYFSEDPYLTGELGIAYVNGLQYKNVAACPKHFAANSQETARYSTNSMIDERAYHEIYLEAFRKVVTMAHPWTIMSAYNKINGTYACENEELLTHILREDWGFKGVVISDWGGTDDRVKSLKAGLDLEMPSSHGYNDAKVLEAYQKQEFNIHVIDESVSRILELVAKTSVNQVTDYPEVLHHELAYELARDSFVLLKNDGILPLTMQDEFIIVGEQARTPHIQGMGSARVNATYVNNPLYELKKLKDKIPFYPGYSDNINEREILLSQAVNAAKLAKTVVLFVGLTDISEAEGLDRTSISLPTNQLSLLHAISKVNKNIIVVLSGGGVIDCSFETDCRALLHTLLMGQAGAKAVAEMLLGIVSPSGKLAETYPLSLKDTPSYKYFPGGIHNCYYVESLYVGYRYYDTYHVPVRYPFGYGLSYTKFKIGAENLLQTKDEITVRCSVTNVGHFDGSEVIQVYVRNKSKKDYYPYQELKGFEKVFLKVNETKIVNIRIPLAELKYYDVKTHRFEVEMGDYEVAVGTSSQDIHRVYPIVVDGTIMRPTPDLTNSCYFTHQEFNELDYMHLLGVVALPPQRVDYKGNYTLNTTFGEVKDTTIGKVFYRQAAKVVSDGSVLTASDITATVDSLTFRFAALGANMSLDQMQGIVDMLNGKLVSGLRKYRKHKGENLNGKA